MEEGGLDPTPHSPALLEGPGLDEGAATSLVVFPAGNRSRRGPSPQTLGLGGVSWRGSSLPNTGALFHLLGGGGVRGGLVRLPGCVPRGEQVEGQAVFDEVPGPIPRRDRWRVAGRGRLQRCL